jgi:hypothetical protein
VEEEANDSKIPYVHRYTLLPYLLLPRIRVLFPGTRPALPALIIPTPTKRASAVLHSCSLLLPKERRRRQHGVVTTTTVSYSNSNSTASVGVGVGVGVDVDVGGTSDADADADVDDRGSDPSSAAAR